MKAVSPLTDKVLAYSAEGPSYDMDEAIDWAFDMLVLGYETPNLLILASLSKPANYFETVGYLEKSCHELVLAFLTGEAGLISYSSFYIKKLAKGEQVKFNLTEVCGFCQASDYAEAVYDFYLLHWTWDDFDYSDNSAHCWPEATPQNIERIVIETAKDWLIKNKILFD